MMPIRRLSLSNRIGKIGSNAEKALNMEAVELQPRILISGYYGFDNAGDEAVLLSILQSLRERRPDWTPVVLSANPKETSRLYGVEAFQRWSRSTVISQIRRSTALVSGGGSLLQDSTGPATLLYYLGIIWAAQLLGKPVFIYAQGLGPLRRDFSRRITGLTLQRVKRIVLRDPESLELLQSLGVTRRAAVTADPVLGLDPQGLIQTEPALKALAGLGLSDRKRPLALINLRPLPQSETAAQERVLRAVGETAARLQNQGWRVLLTPLHWPYDVQVSRPISGIKLLESRLNLPELLGLFSQADLVVGQRLHSLIFAHLFGLPMVGLSYDPKVAAFTKMVNAQGLSPQDLTAVKLLTAVETSWGGRVSWKKGWEKKLPELRKSAQSTVSILIEFLEGTSPGGNYV